jgi:hypothetical protein
LIGFSRPTASLSLKLLLDFSDIDPVGGRFGLFVPRKQPRNDLFMMVKAGDYDGRIVIIDKTGNIKTVPGGKFYVTTDRELLIAQHYSDVPKAVVVALDGRRVIDQTDWDVTFEQLVANDRVLAFRPSSSGKDSIVAAVFDIGKRRFVDRSLSDAEMQGLTVVPPVFEFSTSADCAFDNQ